MKFLVFADFHYKKNMYASTAAHLDMILSRAAEEKADFVIHLGDFSNDYAGSPEVVEAYLGNRFSLPVFGIYGNHELETAGNSMETVTPILCNRNVHFADIDAGYWHYDIGKYRLIGIDTNHSYNTGANQWQHNLPASWGPPEDNLYGDSLSPKQLDWLDAILAEAHTNGQRALIFSHAGLSGKWKSSPDAETVRRIFVRYAGTVLMCLNGHLHTDHFCTMDGIAYFDVNAALNGCWEPSDRHHYTDTQMFVREVYDTDGSTIGTEEAALNTLSQAKNTWFFEEPLSAVVEINGSCIDIKGSRTSWKHGIAPAKESDGIMPGITSRRIILQ